MLARGFCVCAGACLVMRFGVVQYKFWFRWGCLFGVYSLDGLGFWFGWLYSCSLGS